MIKRTLYFGNPAYLSLSMGQLKIRLPEVEKNYHEGKNHFTQEAAEKFKQEAAATIPVEDIGVVILDHKQIVITQALIGALLDNNVALMQCNEQHHPVGLMLPLSGNSLITEKYRFQIEASLPLKKNLWQQTIMAKIKNQAALLAKEGFEYQNMLYWASEVKSGDAENHEAKAAAYYWKKILSNHYTDFKRFREGPPPNAVLNYGYAILRAIVARGIVSSGLLPALGIFHRNKYNAYCLSDDVMEPYRPYVDELILNLIKKNIPMEELNNELKKELLTIPTLDVNIEGEKSPLMVGLQRTTASLCRCFEGVQRKIVFPEML